MREPLRGAAPYISMFGFILLLAGLLARGISTVPQNVAIGTAIVGGILVLAWPILGWEDFRGGLGGRRARFGGNALLLALAVVLGLAAVYFIGTRFYYSADLTENKQFTLQRQTLQVLDNLAADGKEVQLTAVLGARATSQEEQDLRQLAERYTNRSPNIKFTVLRPERDQVAVVALGQRLQKDPNTLLRTLIADSGGKNSQVYSFDEQGFTEAIIKATRPKETQVYFTAGHGEPADDDANGGGFGILKRGLESEGYKVSTVVLGSMTQTLKAGDIVVVAAPQRPFQPAETENLRKFVMDPATKGSLLVMLGSPFNYPAGTPPDLGLEPVWQPWGIATQNNLVLDPAGQQLLNSPLWAIVSGEGWQFHTTTKDLTTAQAAFPASRSITVGTPVSTTYTATTLVKTSAEAWGESDFASLTANAPQPSAEEQGPLTLGVAGEGGGEIGRLMVYGSGVFASDQVLGDPLLSASFANGSLVLNSINWLSADEDLISIRPTAPDSRTLTAPQSPALLWWFLVVLFPLAILGLGVYMWWRRR